MRIIDIRIEATSSVPSDVANNNCVTDAWHRVREALRTVDNTGFYGETAEAPEWLQKTVRNYWAWINEVRASRV